MFNLLIYCYSTCSYEFGSGYLESVLFWSLQNRTDDVNIYFYEYNVTLLKVTINKLQETLNEYRKKTNPVTGKKNKYGNVTISRKNMKINEFYDLNGDKGIIDLRIRVSEDKMFLWHKKRFEDNIPVVFADENYKIKVFNQAMYDKYNKILQEEKERKRIQEEAEHQEWLKQREEWLKEQERKRQIANKTKDTDEKYFISEETGCFYFYKPVNLERFSFSLY